MRQVRLMSPGVLEFRNVPEITEVGPKQLLLRVRRIGICGSEVHSWHGTHPATYYPVVQGHEYSATVVKTGSQVSIASVGDNVTARPQLVCGKCGPCRKGRYNVCENLRVQAFQADGAASDLIIIDEDRIVKLPEVMSLDYGAMIEPVAVAAHASGRTSLEGKNVVVSGAGTIGNLVAQFAKLRGARKVLVTDICDSRLKTASECGIENVANVSKIPLEKACKECFSDEGFQVGFEVAGVESSIRSLMADVEKGGSIVVVAVFGKDPSLSMFHLGEHELSLIGTMMYLHEDYLTAVEAVSKGGVKLSPIVSARFPLEQYDKAYAYLDSHRETAMKVLIDLDLNSENQVI